MLHYWGVGGFVFSEANSERNFSGTATEDRTGLTRNPFTLTDAYPSQTRINTALSRFSNSYFSAISNDFSNELNI